MIEILLHGLKMDPLVSLHYYAPVCAAINLLVLPFTEGLAPFYEIAAGNISWWILLSNASVAFLLNVAAVFLVGVGGGLVLTLAGVFKVSPGIICLNDGGSKTAFLQRTSYSSLVLYFCSVHLSRLCKSLVRFHPNSHAHSLNDGYQVTPSRCAALFYTKHALGSKGSAVIYPLPSRAT